MVIRPLLSTLPLSVFTALLLTACSGNDQPAPDSATPGSSSSVTVGDITAAKPLNNVVVRADTLKLHYKKGEAFRYRIVQKMRSQNDSVSVETVGTHIYTKRIKSIRGDGSYEVGITIDEVQISQKAVRTQGGAVLEEAKYNSKDSASRTDERFLQNTALIGEEVTLILTQRGGIQEIMGSTTIANKILKNKKDIPATQGVQLARAIEQSIFIPFTKEEILNYPDTVQADGTWKRTATMPVNELFTIEQSGVYNIQDVREVKGARIATVNAQITGKVSGVPIPEKLAIKMDILKQSTNGTGHLTLDVDRGFTISKSTNLTMEVAFTVKDLKKGEQQTMHQTSSSSVTVELLP